MYYPEYLRARERNRTDEYRQEIRWRQTIAEGTFASLDRLSWACTRLRGLWKVDCEGYMAALAHKVKKLLRRLRPGAGPPAPALPTAVETAGTTETQDNYRIELPHSAAVSSRTASADQSSKPSSPAVTLPSKLTLSTLPFLNNGTQRKATWYDKPSPTLWTPSFWCGATCGWRQRIFHCPQPAPIRSNALPSCTIDLSNLSLAPAELCKVPTGR